MKEISKVEETSNLIIKKLKNQVEDGSSEVRNATLYLIGELYALLKNDELFSILKKLSDEN